MVGLDKAGKTSSIRAMLGGTFLNTELWRWWWFETAQEPSLCLLSSPTPCWDGTYRRLREDPAKDGKLCGYAAGRRRFGRVQRNLEEPVRWSARCHLCGGLQWQTENQGGPWGSGWPFKRTISGRKAPIGVSITNLVTQAFRPGAPNSFWLRGHIWIRCQVGGTYLQINPCPPYPCCFPENKYMNMRKY